MKRVLILPADFYPNNTGFSNATLNLMNAVNEYCNNIEVHVFTNVPLGNKEELKKVKVIRYRETNWKKKPLTIISKLIKYRYLKKYIEDNKIDFIMLETNTFTFLQSLLYREFKDKLAVRIHSTADAEVLVFGKEKNIYKKIQKKLDLNFMKKVKYVISTNNFHINFVKKYMYEENVYTIWDSKEYYVLPNTMFFNGAAKGIYESDNYLLTMGKMSKNGYIQKGLQDLIKTLYLLKRKNELPANFILKVIGDGEMWDQIKDYTKRLELSLHIEFIKKTNHDETIELINRAKAVILLSRYEGQSMFITEAIALGKPLIITSNNGMKDMIQDNINGFELNSGDIVKASEAIKKIYGMDNNQLKTMGLESKKIYEKKFHPSKISSTFENIVDILIKQNETK